MIAHHIHDALGQVRRLQEMIGARRAFLGYSGPARIAGGVAAIAGAALLARPGGAGSDPARLAGWGLVLVAALAANYGALAAWFLLDREAERDLRRLLPAADALPILGAGAALSAALVAQGAYDLLFGSWMCVYGLVHVPYRLTLPRANYAVGLFYVAAGALCLLTPLGRFANPWPMGLVFFVGETAGGLVLRSHRARAGAERAGEDADGGTEEEDHGRESRDSV